MNVRTIILSLLFFIIAVTVYSQPINTDSLKSALVNSAPSERLEIQLQLADHYRTQNPDTSLFYGNKALAIAKKGK